MTAGCQRSKRIGCCASKWPTSVRKERTIQMCLRCYCKRKMKTARAWHHAARNTVHYAAQFGWFVALTMISLAQVVALEFTMPIWTACLAVGFLGERMNVWKALAIILGLLGVGLIVRPSAATL